MPVCVSGLAALTVASIFYLYRGYNAMLRRERTLRQRVAYLLWVAAAGADDVLAGCA